MSQWPGGVVARCALAMSQWPGGAGGAVARLRACDVTVAWWRGGTLT